MMGWQERGTGAEVGSPVWSQNGRSGSTHGGNTSSKVSSENICSVYTHHHHVNMGWGWGKKAKMYREEIFRD